MKGSRVDNDNNSTNSVGAKSSRSLKKVIYRNGVPITPFYLIHRKKPAHEIEQLAYDYLSWSEKPTSLAYQDFLAERRIPLTTFKQWMKHHEILGATLEVVKMNIGSRREKSSDIYHGHVTQKAAIYDQDLKELNIEMKSVGAEDARHQNDKGSNIITIVEMPVYKTLDETSRDGVSRDEALKENNE